MDWSWITTTWSAVAMSALSVVGIYAALILYTRLAGLRSFSKMSSFDFAMTVAIGSLIASTVLTPDPPLIQAAATLAAVYLAQVGLAALRRRSDVVARLVDNRAVLLMENGRILEDALRSEHVARSDLMAKLREANVFRFDQVRAVVLETTGDISVLHASEEDPGTLDRALLEGVRGA